MRVLDTPRLRLRDLGAEDATFILRLLNEPSFLRYIGDRKVRTADDARDYIAAGPQASYERHGFGLQLVERRADAVPLGICGLLKRDALTDPDLGFAFLPEHWRQGYAVEAARASLDDACERLGLGRIVAITSPDNEASMALLERLGFAYERLVRLSAEEPEVRLFAIQLARRSARPA